MACDTRLAERQTLAERKQEVKEALARLDAKLKKRIAKPVVGPQGSITFAGWDANERSGISDACAYRLLMITGSALAKAEIARAEQMAGRSINRQALAAGVHSHDGGRTWGSH